MASEGRLLLASRSPGKLRELKGVLASAGLRAISLDEAGVAESADEDGIECYDTFEANALAKARYFSALTGLASLADDSGLCVDALGGAPGVWSKRFSGRRDLVEQALDDANNARLSTEMKNATDRQARYRCAAAFVADCIEAVEMGEVIGEILPVARGTGGFGYDPYFFSAELGMTFGEASIDAKEMISHRGRAFRALFDRHRAAITGST